MGSCHIGGNSIYNPDMSGSGDGPADREQVEAADYRGQLPEFAADALEAGHFEGESSKGRRRMEQDGLVGEALGDDEQHEQEHTFVVMSIMAEAVSDVSGK
jgi:hypothetical protein